MKYFIGTSLLMLLLLSGCSNNRLLQQVDMQKQQISRDSLMVVQMSAQMIELRTRMQVLEEKLTAMSEQQVITNDKILNQQNEQLKLRDMLNFQSDRITTMLDNAMDDTRKVLELEGRFNAFSKYKGGDKKSTSWQSSQNNRLPAVERQHNSITEAAVNNVVTDSTNLSANSTPDSTLSLPEGNAEIQIRPMSRTEIASGPEDLYKKARHYYELRKYDEAMISFGDFLKLYPGHALAAAAEYWIAETYYDVEDYQSALTHFRKVSELAPGSEKAADAQFKIGLTYQKLKQNSDARTALELLQRNYPDYSRMDKVRQVLRGL